MSSPVTVDSPPIAGGLFDDFLPEKDAAEKELKVSPQTLAKYRKDGVGPKFTVFKRKIFYQRIIIRQWLADGGAQRPADETQAKAYAPPKARPKRQPTSKAKPVKRSTVAGAR